MEFPYIVQKIHYPNGDMSGRGIIFKNVGFGSITIFRIILPFITGLHKFENIPFYTST